MTGKIAYSILLKKEFINKLISFLNTNGCSPIEKSSVHQIFAGVVDGNSIHIYSSGIVIFSKTDRLYELINEFLIINNIPLSDLENYEPLFEKNTDKTGWKTTPKSIWLSSSQKEIFMSKITSLYPGIVVESDKQKITLKNQGQTLIITSKNTVYTVGGFDGYLEIINEILVDDQTSLNENSKIIAIELQGRWNSWGPVIVSFIIVDISTMIDIQLMGIKDYHIGRSIDFNSQFDKIKDVIEFGSISILPMELNEFSDSIQVNEFLSTKISKFVMDDIFAKYTAETLLIDDELYQIIQKNDIFKKLEDIKIIPKKNRESIPLALASIICMKMLEDWKDDVYKKYGLIVNKKNFNILRNSERNKEILKLWL
ncbi:MAG: hypothetical protein OEZ01_10170 [Candidatus Heimdallarchaeota archaeon]|nr:hypothetical protein [Candidatus Heimdallarchaeota archaeon]